MLRFAWAEISYQPDIHHTSKKAYVEIYWQTLWANLDLSILSTCTTVKTTPHLRTPEWLFGHPALEVIATATIKHAKRAPVSLKLVWNPLNQLLYALINWAIIIHYPNFWQTKKFINLKWLQIITPAIQWNPFIFLCMLYTVKSEICWNFD